MAAVTCRELVELPDCWLVPFDGEKVRRLLVDHALTLDLGERDVDFSIRIEGAFSIKFGNQAFDLSTKERERLGPALQLFGRNVLSARAQKDGTLRIEFSPQAAITVMPHPQFEAWEMYANSGMRLISVPSSGVMVWH